MLELLNKIRISLVLLALSPLVSLGDETKDYSLFLRGLSVVDQNCHSLAKELAEKLSALTLLPSEGRCVALEGDRADVVIRYRASAPLNFSVSSPDLDFPGRGYEFATRRACESQLESEKAYFKSVQGTEPLLVFCRSRENYYGLRRWELAIYGMAQSNIQPRWASSRFPGRPSSSQIEQILSDVKMKFNSPEMNVRFVFLQGSDQGELRFTAMYYGQYGEQLKAFSLAQVDSLSQCEEQMQDLRTVQNADPKKVTLGYCVNNPYSRGADLVAIVDVVNWYQLRHAVESFKNFSDCDSQKDRLVQFYQKEVGENVLAGFCTEWGSEWKLSLISTRRTS